MSIRKEPEMKSIKEYDFGDYHPTAQIQSITDLPKGGTFKGNDFYLDISRHQARKYMEFTEKMKPVERVQVDFEMMKNKEFAVEVMKICSV